MESSSQSGTVYHGNVSSRIYHDHGCRYYNCKNCTREFRVQTRRVFLLFGRTDSAEVLHQHQVGFDGSPFGEQGPDHEDVVAPCTGYLQGSG